MADIKTAFRTKSISLDNVVAIFQGNLDPRTNDQGTLTQVPQGSLYIRSNGELYQKTGTANLDFSLITATGSAVTILDTDLSNTLTLLEGSNLTADRTLTFTTGDASRVLTINGNATLNDWFDQNVKTTGTPTFAQMFSSGNVGIGTTSPQTNLHVLKSGTPFILPTGFAGAFQQSSGSLNCSITCIASSTGISGYAFGDPSNANIGIINYLHSVDSMTFIANAAERMRIDSSGNVGIGTITPGLLGAQLTIASGGTTSISISKGNLTSDAGIRIFNGATPEWFIGTGAALNDSSLDFIDGGTGTSRVHITSSGNVGVGTTSPTVSLDVVGDIKATGTITGTLSFTRFHVQTSGVSATPTGDIVAKFEKSATTESAAITILSSTAGLSSLNMGDTVSEVVGNIAYSNASDYMSFTTNGSEAMRIDSSGNVGIGTTTPTSILDINKVTLAGVLDTTALNITRSTTITTTGVSTDYAALFDIRNVSIDVAVQDGGTKGGLSARANIQTAGFAGILTNNVGVWGTAGISQATSGAAITRVYGLRSTIKNNVNGTTITDAYGVHITNNETGGTITNRYDLYASSANALNYFAGSVGIGTTNPTTTLDVNGAITASSLSLTTVLSTSNGGTGQSSSHADYAKIGIYFNANKTTTQNIPNNTLTKVTFFSSVISTVNSFSIDPSTGIFTFLKSGQYFVVANINIPNGQSTLLQIVHNNTTVKLAFQAAGNSTSNAVSGIINMAVNDTLDVRVTQTSGSTQSISGGATLNNFQAIWVSK